MPSVSPRGRRLLAAALAVAAISVAPADSLGSATEQAQTRTTGDACGDRLPKPGGGAWRCSFVDNFDGTELDTDKWSTQDTVKSGFRSGMTCYRGDSNVRVRRGALRLRARAGATVDCSNPYGAFYTPYTGGLVSTRDHFSQTYGRFEIRAKYPTARTSGVHGAFWMYPRQHTYGPWPASGEIDVAEWWSNDPYLLLPTLHYNGRNFHADSGWSCRVSNPSKFHTYTVEWYPTGMRFFIDGSMCYDRKWAPELPQVPPQPFDHPFSIILNMGVGTAGGTNMVSSDTELPATFSVDYAKAWR
jgi:beta-glucanase (GH16 family)